MKKRLQINPSKNSQPLCLQPRETLNGQSTIDLIQYCSRSYGCCQFLKVVLPFCHWPQTVLPFTLAQAYPIYCWHWSLCCKRIKDANQQYRFSLVWQNVSSCWKLSHHHRHWYQQIMPACDSANIRVRLLGTVAGRCWPWSHVFMPKGNASTSAVVIQFRPCAKKIAYTMTIQMSSSPPAPVRQCMPTVLKSWRLLHCHCISHVVDIHQTY